MEPNANGQEVTQSGAAMILHNCLLASLRSAKLHALETTRGTGPGVSFEFQGPKLIPSGESLRSNMAEWFLLTSIVLLLVKHYFLEEPALREGESRPLDESPEEIMNRGSSLAVVAVIFISAGFSNHVLHVKPRTAAHTGAGVTSFFPAAPISRPVSEAPGIGMAAPVPEVTERAKPDLLPAIAAASDHDRKEFCQESQSANCDKDFMQAFHFRKVALNKSGQVGFIVEFSGAGFCGSAGCSMNVLKQNGEKFERTLENDEVGSLDSFEFATTTTNGFYDLTKHGKDGTDYGYSWTGSNYEDVEATLSAGQERTVAGASESKEKECNNCATARTAEVPFIRNLATIR